MTITVALLAEEKRLPVSFLRQLGLKDSPQGVLIPYHATDGTEVAVKLRFAVRARDGSRWPKGTPLSVYGADRLADGQKMGITFLVEGESDCWTLWYHGLPALGLPGANTASVLHAEHVDGINVIYIHQEPDTGGEKFVSGVRARLEALHFQGEVRILQMPNDVKDPAELHARSDSNFLETWRTCVESSCPVIAAEPVTNKPLDPRWQPVPITELKRDLAAGEELITGILARGCITLLAAEAKAGKTTLLSLFLQQMQTGGEMIGLDIAKCRALVVSEEPSYLWIERREKLRLTLGEQLQIMTMPFLSRPSPKLWTEFVAHLVTTIKTKGFDVIILDTIGKLFPVQDENDNARMTEAVMTLRALSEAGAAVWAIAHMGVATNKARGATSINADVDQICLVNLFTPGDFEDPRRVLRVRGRMTSHNSKFVIRLNDAHDEYELLEGEMARGTVSTFDVVEALLPTEPPGLSEAEILERWPEEYERPTNLVNIKRDAKKRNWQTTGKGVKGSPTRYWRIHFIHVYPGVDVNEKNPRPEEVAAEMFPKDGDRGA